MIQKPKRPTFLDLILTNRSRFFPKYMCYRDKAIIFNYHFQGMAISILERCLQKL